MYRLTSIGAEKPFPPSSEIDTRVAADHSVGAPTGDGQETAKVPSAETARDGFEKLVTSGETAVTRGQVSPPSGDAATSTVVYPVDALLERNATATWFRNAATRATGLNPAAPSATSAEVQLSPPSRELATSTVPEELTVPT